METQDVSVSLLFFIRLRISDSCKSTFTVQQSDAKIGAEFMMGDSAASEE